MSITAPLSDPFGRQFSYLRLSLTELCNFRCSYCLPDGYQKCLADPPLSMAEILRLVRAFAALGVWKIRLTGGEPTIRPDFLDIASAIAQTEGIRKLAMTTNGYRLRERAQTYKAAGVHAINISIDSLDPARFARITGHDRLQEIMEGLDSCLTAGFQDVKINTVLLKGLNESELEQFIAFAKDRPVSIRFIELMLTRDNGPYFKAHHLSGARVAEILLTQGWQAVARQEGDGPACEYRHPEAQGRVGLIAPYSKDFCASCNRLRVSSVGALHLCLFGEGGYSLRPLLARDDQLDALCDAVRSAMGRKRSAHDLHRGDTGATRHLASIGG